MNTAILYTAYTADQVTNPTWLPPDVFSSWSEDGTNITVPIASFSGLLASAADATTGDARELVRSICSTIFGWYNTLSTVPEALTISYRSRGIQGSGDFAGKEWVTYTVDTYIDYGSRLIADEPSN